MDVFEYADTLRMNKPAVYKMLDALNLDHSQWEKVMALKESSVDRLAESMYASCRYLGIEVKEVDRLLTFFGVEYREDYHKNALYVDRVFRQYLIDSGSMGMNSNVLMEDVKEELSKHGMFATEKKVKQLINEMIVRGDYSYEVNEQVDESGAIYDEANQEIEEYVADLLVDLTSRTVESLLTEALLNEAEKNAGIELAAEQKQAIMVTNTNTVTMVVGGPGTGKSTMQNTLIQAYKAAKPDIKILLLAPTGRAASRMTEVSGVPAYTAHSALGMNEREDFLKNKSLAERVRERNAKFDADLIIVDEVSMVDMDLFAHILYAVRPGARIVFCGDDGQLPSVGRGAVCRELVRLGKQDGIGYTKLRVLFRQDEESAIAKLSEAIDNGDMDGYDLTGDICYTPDKDCSDAKERRKFIKESILDAIQEELNNGVPLSEIIVLAPIRRVSEMGCNRLNLWLQDRLIPGTGNDIRYEVKREKYTKIFRVGSRVMQNTNERRAKNGELGTVREIRENSLLVEFDERKRTFVEYSYKDLDRLELAFVVTIHKSQGSQFHSVIIPLEESYRKMGTRELYKTAVSRARKKLHLIGDISIIQSSARKCSGVRVSNLADRVLRKQRNRKSAA